MRSRAKRANTGTRLILIVQRPFTLLLRSYVHLVQISGAIIASAAFEVLLGFTGIVGFLLRWVTPLGIAPCIALVGLSLFEEAARLSAGNWGASLMLSTRSSSSL
ncbi:hypothetical protein HPB51_019369 [Rhipicephalus microplus]|uniref:Uncharacterized protein n=1 Tax=Rhipicephalus microplus TaxID=6941 RepID=A0A9J6DB64_RHIMP|nr:hypothetical protein HPB51_019369 [Rhipicephalus microplus]